MPLQTSYQTPVLKQNPIDRPQLVPDERTHYVVRHDSRNGDTQLEIYAQTDFVAEWMINQYQTSGSVVFAVLVKKLLTEIANANGIRLPFGSPAVFVYRMIEHQTNLQGDVLGIRARWAELEVGM